MRRLLVASVALLASTAASAKPVYLDCLLDSGGGEEIAWAISLNEEAGTITFSHKYATKTERANFTPDFVTWGGGDMKIDRSSLKFSRTFDLGSIHNVHAGQCKLDVGKKRAF